MKNGNYFEKLHFLFLKLTVTHSTEDDSSMKSSPRQVFLVRMP